VRWSSINSYTGPLTFDWALSASRLFALYAYKLLTYLICVYINLNYVRLAIRWGPPTYKVIIPTLNTRSALGVHPVRLRALSTKYQQSLIQSLRLTKLMCQFTSLTAWRTKLDWKSAVQVVACQKTRPIAIILWKNKKTSPWHLLCQQLLHVSCHPSILDSADWQQTPSLSCSSFPWPVILAIAFFMFVLPSIYTHSMVLPILQTVQIKNRIISFQNYFGCLGGCIGWALDSWSKGRRFDSRPGRYQVN